MSQIPTEFSVQDLDVIIDASDDPDLVIREIAEGALRKIEDDAVLIGRLRKEKDFYKGFSQARARRRTK